LFLERQHGAPEAVDVVLAILVTDGARQLDEELEPRRRPDGELVEHFRR
jgi:hypothetical protein